MTTALEMTPDKWRKYKPTKSIASLRAKSSSLKENRERALKVAQKASALLRNEFGAIKVVLFGSIISKEYFHASSDIDLAAWGIAPDKFYLAVAGVTGISSEFKIDLVEPDNCRDAVKISIQQHGIEI